MAKKKKVAYIVFRGRKPGIYQSWDECKAQTDGFSGCDHRGFDSLLEAERVWEEFMSSTPQSNAPRQLHHENYSGYNELQRYNAKRPALVDLTGSDDESSQSAKRHQQQAPSSIPLHFRVLGDAMQRAQNGASNSSPGVQASFEPYISKLPSKTPFVNGDSYIPLDADSNKSDEEFEIDEDANITLTAEQEAVVDMALRGENIFLTGAGGCGKTVTLKKILARFKRRKILYQVVAPTGIAALPLNGKTTYSLLGWNPDTFQTSIEEILEVRKKNVVKAVTDLRVLIIEEISMVENQFLERMNLMMQAILGNTRPFGGKQVIFLGDFHQLPPVKPFEFCLECGGKMVHLKTPEYDVICENCNTNFSDSQKWAFKSSVWPKLKLRHVQLQQIHRQKDHQFQDILYKIRHGIMLNVEQWKILESRKELPRGICAVRLMSRRKDVDALNARELSQIQSPAKSWEALDFYNPRFEGPVKDLKPWESEKPLDNHRFPKTVTLKVGAKVVLLSNIDQKNGLVNGSQGEVVGFQKHRGMECDPSITYLEADSAQTKRGSKKKTWNAETRAAPVVRFANGITRPIFAVDVSSRTGKQKNYQYLATRVQIPLALAWALTIHKSQGMTLSYLEVLSRDIFERGQFYVALSRGTSLAGLTVTGYTREQLPVDKDVTEFYQNTTWESFAPVRDPPASQPNEAEKQTEETTEIPDTNAKSYAGLDQNVLEQE